MSAPMADRVLALAALAQALLQVRRIAETGQSDPAATAAVIDGVFRIDAPSTEAVYGRALALAPGLRLLRERFGGTPESDPALPRLGMAVMQLARRFVGAGRTVRAVADGLRQIEPKARELGSAHPEVLAALGRLYSDTLSQLRPRVLVQGNPHYLGQPAVVAEIRAILLAAVRAAVLWRQLGGSWWDLLFSRRAMLRAVQERLR
ncbi:MAG: high frequency lysogenization protein HflD [Pseudoxanthomonas sp.]